MGADVGGVGLGVPFDDEFVPDAKFLYGDPIARIEVPSFDCVVVTTGDRVMLAATGDPVQLFAPPEAARIEE